MTWDEIARKLLAGTVASGVVVDRAVVAPGSGFARDCRMFAVHLEQVQTVPAALDEFARAAQVCAWATQLVFVVTFVADCLPTFDDAGNPPAAAAVTDWSTRFLADAGRVQAALTNLVDTGDLGPPCDVQLGNGTPTGPLGGVAEIAFPVTILLTTPQEQTP